MKKILLLLIILKKNINNDFLKISTYVNAITNLIPKLDKYYTKFIRNQRNFHNLTMNKKLLEEFSNEVEELSIELIKKSNTLHKITQSNNTLENIIDISDKIKIKIFFMKSKKSYIILRFEQYGDVVLQWKLYTSQKYINQILELLNKYRLCNIDSIISIIEEKFTKNDNFDQKVIYQT